MLILFWGSGASLWCGYCEFPLWMVPVTEPARSYTLSEPNEKQKRVMDIIENAAPGTLSVIGYGGAVGGGKTWLLASAALKLSLSFPGNRGVVGRDEFNKLESTTLQEFDKLVPPSLVKRAYNQPPVYRDIRMPYWPDDVVSRIYFRGLANWQSFGSEEYGFALLEEASEIPKMAAFYMMPRLRHRLPKKVEDLLERTCRTCTKKLGQPVRVSPENMEWHATQRDEMDRPHQMDGMKYVYLAASNPWPGWFTDVFHRRKLDDFLDALPTNMPRPAIHFVPAKIADNPHLPAGYAEQQRAILMAGGMGEMANRLIDGKFDTISGRIYERFDEKIHCHLGPTPEKKDYRRIIGGIDFGGANTATSHYTAAVIGVVTHNNRIIWVDEFKERGPNINARLMQWMLMMQEKWGAPIQRRIEWRADRSQGAAIETWTHWFRIAPSLGGKGSVEEGIKKVAAKLEKDGSGYPGMVYLPHLTNLVDEFETYHRDPESMKIIEENDDLIDALRYALEAFDKPVGDPNKMLGQPLAVVSQR